jgi:diguanylate cyclase
LTGLPNRRAFERRLVSAAIEARAKGEKLSLAFCDVDRFKLINDRHGHEAGDRVLCAVAQTLNEHAGDACFVARHGGEEFVLLFYGMDKEAARLRLDAIRCAQAHRQLMNRETGQPFGRITFSGGVAEVTEDADTRSALARADAALYRAKQDGRNRVMVG